MVVPYQVRHALPGRVRLRIPAVAGDRELAEALQGAFSALPGVKSVRASRISASFVIQHDRRHTDLLGDVHSVLSNPIALPPESQGFPPIPRGRRWTGRSLLAMGVAGWLLPVIPGTPFAIAGVMVLGKNDPIVRYGAKAIGRILKGIWRRGGDSNPR